MQIVTRVEAIKSGLTHYYTGKPCKHEHLSKRRANDRVCMECDAEHKKPPTIEYKRLQYHSGLALI